MFGIVVSGIVYLGCAAIFIGIGIHDIKSKKPVSFYTGEKPLEADQISDVDAWNRKHGIMWIIYGGIVAASWICGLFCKDSEWILIPYFGGLLIPIIFIVMYHNKLKKQYIIR